MIDNTQCTLTDAELVEKVKDLNNRLIRTGGRDWTLHIPARPNSDPDLLIAEICERFKNKLLPKVCTGCGHLENEPIGKLSCCPDNNHIPMKEYIDNSKYTPPTTK